LEEELDALKKSNEQQKKKAGDETSRLKEEIQTLTMVNAASEVLYATAISPSRPLSSQKFFLLV